MTGIDELVREALSADASTHHVAGDLAARSMADGRRIRTRRRVAYAATSAASVVGIVVGSLVLSGTVGTGTDRVIAPAQGGQSAPGDGRATSSDAPTNPGLAWWKSWSTDRTYGDKPTAGFMSASGPDDFNTIYASGTMNDGTEFVVGYDPQVNSDHVPGYFQGAGDSPDFGQDVGEGPESGPAARYLAVMSPTVDAQASAADTSQWLIVVAEPGTTSASYSDDGTTWRDMKVEHGIAVIKLPSVTLTDPQIRLSKDDGQYVDGPLALP